MCYLETVYLETLEDNVWYVGDCCPLGGKTVTHTIIILMITSGQSDRY
jgi:hypothetical protein